MLTIKYTSSYKRDYKRIKKRNYDISELNKVIYMLMNQIPLPAEYLDHELEISRNYKNVRECHIKNDWLLVYRIFKNELILELLHTGTHSDLF